MYCYFQKPLDFPYYTISERKPLVLTGDDLFVLNEIQLVFFSIIFVKREMIFEFE